jgi:hypothetical protein
MFDEIGSLHPLTTFVSPAYGTYPRFLGGGYKCIRTMRTTIELQIETPSYQQRIDEVVNRGSHLLAEQLHTSDERQLQYKDCEHLVSARRP